VSLILPKKRVKNYWFYRYALLQGTCFKTVHSLQIFSSLLVMNCLQCCLFFLSMSCFFSRSLIRTRVLCYILSNTDTNQVILHFIVMRKIPFLVHILLRGAFLNSYWYVEKNTQLRQVWKCAVIKLPGKDCKQQNNVIASVCSAFRISRFAYREE
jgi:hypothetical protein